MEQIAATAVKRAVFMALLLIALLMAFGCTGLWMGASVAPDDRIMFFEKQSGQGVYNSGHLTVHYSYSLKGRTLHLGGNVDYRRGLDYLDVYVPIVDASGNILTRYIVYYSGYRVGHRLRDNTFQDDLHLPPDAAGFSFSYSAQAGYPKR